MRAWPTEIRRPLLCLSLVAAFGVSVAFSLGLTRGSEGVATIWPAGAIMAAAFLTLPRRLGIVAGVAGFLIHFTINRLVGNPLPDSLIFPALCMGEAFGAAWLARKTCGQTLRLTSLARVARLILFAVAPATAAGSVLAADLFTLFGRSFNVLLANWFFAHALGMAIVLPATLLILRGDAGRDFRRPVWEQLALYAVMAGMSLLAFAPVRFPMPLLFFPILMIVAFRLGPRGAAVSALIMAALSASLVVSAPISVINADWTPMERIRGLQFLIAVGFFTCLATSLAIADQKRLKRLWASRTRVARAAEARALSAGRAKTDFLATMSHEIRTPLHSMLGFTNVLRGREDLPAPAQRQLALIDGAGVSLMALVNDILDISKIEARAVELHPKPAAPRAIAQDAVAMLAEAARHKGLDLRLQVTGPVDRPVMIDDLRVRQILLNLLENAIKFTARGRVRLDLSADGADLLRFAITDTGCGVAADHAELLFKPFSQADSSASRAHGGAGLGLAISKGLAELMGGRIGMDSREGFGATFWFEIPAVPAPEAMEAPASAAANVLGAALKARVLLVDDHPTNRELGATVLSLLGCEVVLAENGEEAVAMARDGTCDLILMDVHMPRMDGLEATRLIRALDGRAGKVPIIAVSADVLPEMEARCLAAGMVEAVGKPIQITALHGVLTKWLAQAPDARAA
jgi:signal transduction histidine kinase/ActR/RegA family two-component response regulator